MMNWIGQILIGIIALYAEFYWFMRFDNWVTKWCDLHDHFICLPWWEMPTAATGSILIAIAAFVGIILMQKNDKEGPHE